MSESATPSLRERQAEGVRAALRGAFIGLVLERGGTGFSLHDVAQAAGVSDRTLYRHYPSREALVEAIATEEAAAMEAERHDDVGEARLHGDSEWLADAFEVFERHADLVRALRMLRVAGDDSEASADRSRQVRELLAGSEGIHPAAVAQLTALVRLITGADGWARMVQPDLGLDTREAGYASHWAVQVLLEAAREADGPLRPAHDVD